jgi:hypothetical protein
VSGEHNELRYYARLVGAINRQLGMAPDQDGITRLNESLGASFDPFSLIEWALYRGSLWCATTHTVTAGGAGTYAKSMLYNPPGNKLVVVRGIEVWCATPGVYINVYDPASIAGWAATYVGGSCDTRRQPPTAIPWAQSYRLADATQVGSTRHLHNVAGGPVNNFRGFVIRPGAAAVVQVITANVGESVGWVWDEREAMPGELLDG